MKIELIRLEDRTQPNATPPQLLTDLYISQGSGTGEMLAFGETVYYTANDAVHGAELWISDAQGTRLVCDIRPGTSGSSPDEFAVVNGLLFFVANDGVTGSELWRSDGTSGGTWLVKDIRPGASGSGPEYLTEANGLVFCRAFDGATGDELWRSDGTSTGTFLLGNIDPAGIGSTPTLAELTNVGGTLFFRIRSGTIGGTGIELWKSDGSIGGTQLVKDIRPDTGGSNQDSNPSNLTNLNGILYFSARDNTSPGVWRSDGTSSGTILVRRFPFLPYVNNTLENFLNLRGTLYFSANHKELWRSEGTSSGTVMFESVGPGDFYGHLSGFASFNNNLYFAAFDVNSAGHDLWGTDGTSSGTMLVRSFRLPGGGSLTTFPPTHHVFGNNLYFIAGDPAAGGELWRSNGTSTGSVIVRDIMPGRGSGFVTSSASPLLVASKSAIFFRGDDAIFGAEPWKSDGTSAGTARVHDVNISPASSAVTNLTAAETSIFFKTNAGTNASGWLWHSDGTSSGTERIGIFDNTNTLPSPAYLHDTGNNLYFFGTRPETGLELWKSYGTSSGTLLVSDINPGTGSSRTSNTYGNDMLMLNGTLYFSATNGSTGLELWKTNGAASNTTLVRDIRPGASSSGLKNFIVLNNTLFFTANDGTNGSGLWRSDGTFAGTTLVRPGSVSNAIAVHDNYLYFAAVLVDTGRELWRSDGTSGGTQLVRDIYASTSDGLSLTTPIAATGPWVFFTANDGTSGVELWRSDGSSSGTALVRDIIAGALSSNPANFKVIGSILYFTVNDAVSGTELWRSDGSSSGTYLVRDVNPGAASASPTTLTDHSGFLYFSAIDVVEGVNSRELWRSDGTSSGTMRVDVDPIASGSPTQLASTGDKLFFYSNRVDSAEEIFFTTEDLIPPAVASIDSASPNGTYNTGQTITITPQFSEIVKLTGGNLLFTLDSGAVIVRTPFTGLAPTLSYTIGAGESSPDLNVVAISLAPGASLTDLAGNPASLALPASNNLAVNANLIVNPLPPTVANLAVNAGVVQRSRLTGIQVTFTAPINAAALQTAGAATLTRTAATAGGTVGTVVQTGAAGANGRVLISPSTGMVSSIALTFDNADGSGLTAGVEFFSLADGRWMLAIPSLNYQSALNDPDLRRLFGDENADGTVDGNDLAAFGTQFGTTGINLLFDFNADLTVDALDFGEFGNRFGVTL